MSGVLVFDEDVAPAALQEFETDIIVFDPDVIGGEVATSAATDFLLIDSGQTQTTVVTEDETDLLVLTPSGMPGPPGAPGPEGPQGIPGADGAGVYYETFGFATPSTLWTIVHNRNTVALNVETIDESGEPLEGNVRFVDANTIQIDWYYPTAGEARLFR